MIRAPFPSSSAVPVRAPAASGAAAAAERLPEWDLSALYPSIDGPEVAADLERVFADSRAFEEAWKGKLAEIAAAPDGGAQLGRILADYEVIDELYGRLGSFAGLVYSVDTSDAKRSKFYGDIQQKLTDAGLHLLFFTLEFNRIEDDVLEAALKDPALAHYEPWVRDVRLGRPHQLDDEIERLFSEKASTSWSSWSRLFDETVSSLTFEIGGETLTIEAALDRLSNPDEAVRREAAGALAKTFKSNLRLFSLIFNTLVKDKEIHDRWHHYPEVDSWRHQSNRVEPEVVAALVAAVREAFPRLSHRYYALKAKWMGKERLEYWDRNAPLPSTVERVFTWEEARDTVLAAYERFSPEMRRIAEPFFKGGWIDAPIRPGKATGAFAHPTVPSAHPYLLLNYQGRVRDVMTLAHELGHGVHQVLAAPNGSLMAPTPLTLAETASVFGEMLTFRALLAEAKDKTARKAMLASKVEDMINTVVRQIAFYSFEKKVHLARREGELTPEAISALWMDVQSESLGPAIHLGEGYETYWCYISHFIHSPFYVYAYAYGDCLVNSLYSVYEHAAEGFQEKYFDLLKAGGTKHYSELLAPFGLDAKDPAFWSKGLSVIEGLIDELEALEQDA